MEQHRFDLLTRRHRECLRRVRQLKGSKEIADELALSKSTVDGYLTEAVRLLGARNRRDAAMMLDAHERLAAQGPGTEDDHGPRPAAARTADPVADARGWTLPPVRHDPHKVMPDSARLADPAPALPGMATPTGKADGGTGLGVKQALSRMPLPLRRQGQTGNDMGVAQRLLWIPTIAVVLAIGFGMLASGLEVLTGVIVTASRLIR